MIDPQAEPQDVVEQFKTLFAQMQQLTQNVSHQDLMKYISADPQMTELQRHIFNEFIQNQPSQPSIFRDELTGLLVRSSLVERLEQALVDLQNNAAVLAVCFVDLDGFKEINDQYGHAVGDQVLALAGSCLQSSIRADDLLCRWGGDEFVVVLKGIDRPESVEGLVNRLLGAITNPLRLSIEDPLTLFLGACIGVSIVTSAKSIAADQKLDAITLIKQADQAMYAAKKAGKNRVEIVA